ncbi:MAG: LptF/LptG family permease, partial [Pseudomonadota bacterium]
MTLAPRLTLYLMRTTLIAIGLVTLVLTGLYFTFQVIREAGDLSGDYGLVAMLWYLIRSLPTGVYDMFPFAVLIGSMIAAGRLASSRELVAMRASGFDRGAIALRLVLAAMTASVAMMAMAEWWMPDLELQARTDREHALNEQVAAAGGRRIWTRDDQTMVRADIVLNDPDLGIRFTNVQMYRLNQGQSPALWLSAATATHSDGRWALKQVQALNLTDARQQSVASMMLPSSINPDVFVAFSTRARLLSMADIRRIAGYLDANGLETSTYQA